MGEHNLGQLGGQDVRAKSSLRHGRVDRVSREVHLFSLDSISDTHVVKNVLLRPVLDSDVSQTKGYILTSEHALSVGALVHNIDLGQDTNSSQALRV